MYCTRTSVMYRTCHGARIGCEEAAVGQPPTRGFLGISGLPGNIFRRRCPRCVSAFWGMLGQSWRGHVMTRGGEPRAAARPAARAVTGANTSQCQPEEGVGTCQIPKEEGPPWFTEHLPILAVAPTVMGFDTSSALSRWQLGGLVDGGAPVLNALVVRYR